MINTGTYRTEYGLESVWFSLNWEGSEPVVSGTHDGTDGSAFALLIPSAESYQECIQWSPESRIQVRKRGEE